MLRYLTAGESHGKCLVGILEGIPANLVIDFDFINAELARRQHGYGRGARMRIETDRAEFVAGVRGGKTTGAPIGFLIANRDHENWSGIIGAHADKLNERTVTAVRPGHADLAGCIKYRQDDARNILERASARATAQLVTIGAIAKLYLKELGVSVGSYTAAIGGARDGNCYDFDRILAQADNSPVRALDKKAEAAMMKLIDEAVSAGDTLGGEVCVVAHGTLVGLGSHIAADRRLEFKLSGYLAAIPSVKSVAVGNICAYVQKKGSEFHDALEYDAAGKICRKTNNAGGIEGGISNGEDIVFTLGLKPVPSVPSGVASVDIAKGVNAESARERGDACVVTPAGVVAEAVLAYGLAEAIAETLGGDHMAETVARFRQKKEYVL